MLIILGALLAMSGSVSAMDVNIFNCSIEILNNNKKSQEPTIARIITHETSFIKFYKGTIDNFGDYKHIIGKEQHVYIDNCVIKILNKIPEVKKLDISNSTIEAITRNFHTSLITLKTVKNRITSKAFSELSGINTNKNIVIDKNTVLEDDANN